MPVSEVNGVQIGWERLGSGPPLLFCNGSGSTLADAQPMLAQLAGGFDLLAWDYRGFGTCAAVTGSYTMADLAADAEGLLRVAGWDHCRVVGVSFGGMVAQELAVTSPALVERLALACTSSGGAGGSSYPLHELQALPPEERAAAGLKLADSRWDEEWFDSHPVDRVISERLAPKTPADPAQGAAREAQLKARAGHDVWARLPLITCPTLVGCGRYDGIAPPENARAIASRVPNAELREYEGGHPYLFQDPTAAPDLVAFLRDEG